MDVGVRELKAHLSDYLDRAEKGETIRVTHRGRPKAILGPRPTGRDADSPSLRIEQGIREGWLAPPNRRVPDFRKVKSFPARRTVAELIDEDRGE